LLFFGKAVAGPARRARFQGDEKMAGDKVVAVNDDNFASEVLQADKPVLVDFTASWCGPCRMVSPLVEQLAGEYEGRAKVAKLDVDESPQTARKYSIRGVPTLMVLKGGEVVSKMVGAAPKAQIAGMIEEAL
jgi:thioredoxin 1